MKKLFVTVLMLIALLTVTVGTAFAGSALELYKVQHNSGGITFTFKVNGEFSADELASGFVQVSGGDAFPLYCSQTAPDEVVCHTSKKVAGHDVVVGFGGARFWTDVPAEWVAPGTCAEGYGYWYPVYDFDQSPGQTDFVYWGDYCTDAEPAAFDVILLDGAPSNGGVAFAFLTEAGQLGSWSPGLPYYDWGWYQ